MDKLNGDSLALNRAKLVSVPELSLESIAKNVFFTRWSHLSSPKWVFFLNRTLDAQKLDDFFFFPVQQRHFLPPLSFGRPVHLDLLEVITRKSEQQGQLFI